MRLYSTQNYYLLELHEIFFHNFLEECARLAEQKPHLTDKQIESMGEQIVKAAMYYDQKYVLKRNLEKNTTWRIDLR